MTTSSCHFWNQESVFLQTLHHSLVPWNITLLYCFYLNLYLKKDPINVQIFRLSTVHMKINKLFMSFFEPQVSFTLNFASPFSVMTHNSSEIFWLKHYKKEPINIQFFRLLSALMKVQLIPHTIFQSTRSRFIQNLRHCSVSWKITPLYFFSSNLIHFGWTKRPHQKEMSTLLSGWVQIHQIFHVMFETTSQFFFKICITLQCHER